MTAGPWQKLNFQNIGRNDNAYIVIDNAYWTVEEKSLDGKSMKQFLSSL